MTETGTLDTVHLRRWIGRTETAGDVITPRLASELRATLEAGPAPIDDLPPAAIHWCLAPPVVPGAALGPDGHPARGGFLPPVPLPRRMWAGGTLRFHDRLLVGDVIERRSRIADVTVKQGRTGTLCFVAVDHEIHTPRGLALTERHDIVYRGGDGGAPGDPPGRGAAAEFRHAMQADAVTLFRYSAVTFNGHRIHYDRPYVTGVEHYPGLIVHGPLQATLLIGFAAAIEGRIPVAFEFRGLQPLFDFMPFTLCAARSGGRLDLWIETGDGARTMRARADW